MLYNELLDELRQRATRLGSVRKLADDLGLDPATLHRWLNGHTKQANLSHVLAVAEQVGWSKTKRSKLVTEFTESQTSRASLEARIAALEQTVAEQGRELAELNDDLRAALGQLTRQHHP